MATTDGGGVRRPFGALAVCALFATAVLLMPTTGLAGLVTKSHVQPLGMKQCTWGPTYWCQNITNAAGCKAVKHCIQTTWETQKFPEDTDDICTICKNMVKEARDTLKSNVTLEELQEVFYGSCQLLPLKMVKTECKKLADEFIPELVDTLASQMDPNVVCTVSGLCNSERIDKLLLEYKQYQPNVDDEQHECEKCAIVMDKGENLVQSMSKNEMLNKILMICGELSSYSDACSTIVLTYKNEIYTALKEGFNKRNMCMLSGMCSEAFHPHADGYEKARNALIGVEISNAGERGRIQVAKPSQVNDDLTCEFCETLVKHLKDILVANTTEDQFLDVLKGICKQTGSFSDECTAMVEENYARFYTFLTSELKGKVLCTIVGICPKSQSSRHDLNNIVPMYPLIPIDLLPQAQETKQIKEDSSFAAMNEQSKQKPSLIIVDEQPPKVKDIKPIKKSPVIDVFYKELHFVVDSVDMPQDKTACFLCQSILNYLQQAVTNPKSEDEIREELEKSCVVVPKSFKEQCTQFIDQYADAFIALMAQEVDPSVICPKLNLCPAREFNLITTKDNEQTSNCQMCVMFMSAVESEVSNKDTEAMMVKKLEQLCGKFPLKWKTMCTDFVANQLQTIIDMLVAEVPAEEMCVLMDFCEPKTLSDSVGGDIETNMIASSGKVTVILPGYDMIKLITNDYKMLEEPKVPTPLCFVCTVVMKYIHTAVKDKSNEDEIQSVLDSVCSVLPNVEEKECQNFIDSNYQSIVSFIKIGTDPGLACTMLMVCDKNTGKDEIQVDDFSKEHELQKLLKMDSSIECTACEAVVKVFGDRLQNDSFEIDEIDMIELCSEVDVLYKNQVHSYHLIDLKSGCEDFQSESTDNGFSLRIFIQSMQTICSKPCMTFHPKCLICLDVIKDIKTKIKVSPVEEEIKFRLESLCDPLPDKDKCVNFVERNTVKFLNTLVDDINEKSVCQEIGYC